MKQVFIVNNGVYNTLEEAMQVANFMYNTNGVIAGVETITPKKPQLNRMYSVSKYIQRHGIAQYVYVCRYYQTAHWHGEVDSLFKVTQAKSAL